ncbi:MAG TPA: endonuclease/exonuclease/phosphatase family protein [bacterium]|nr:endonuclease/exonuclease/phosphatase family protein [bacterium]
MKKFSAAIVFVLMLALAAPAGARDRSVPPTKPAKHSELDTPELASFSRGDVPFTGEFQVVAFNLERGVHFDDELAYFRELQRRNPATVLLLSECDKYHRRSGDRFIARDLAENLNMDMAFVVEYVELNDQTPATPATHGNAILSPFPLTDVTVLRHRVFFSWERWGWIYGQPRRGGVVALAATVNFPDGRQARVFCLHLESNTIHPLRAVQLEEVFPDAAAFTGPVVMGGDFNSIPHSAALRVPKKIGLQNAFAHDWTPTGWCFFPDDSLHCIVKIDWVLFRGLDLVSRDVTTLMTADHHRVSDHAAVSAVFSMK